jgi:hypothetical protein
MDESPPTDIDALDALLKRLRLWGEHGLESELCDLTSAADCIATVSAEVRALRARVAELELAAGALIDDVRSRYPGEDLRCPHMIALDTTLKGPDHDR